MSKYLVLVTKKKRTVGYYVFDADSDKLAERHVEDLYDDESGKIDLYKLKHVTQWPE